MCGRARSVKGLAGWPRKVNLQYRQLSRRLASGRAQDSQNYARIAEVLVALEQVDLLRDDFPAGTPLPQPVAAPAGQDAGFIAPEFADQEIRAHHVNVLVRGRKYLD